jgi:uncharacterized protein
MNAQPDSDFLTDPTARRSPAEGLLCVFAKAPEPGRVKTRLAPVLGAAWAAELAEAFLVDTWSKVTELTSVQPVLVLSGESRLPALDPEPTIWHQGDGDLGARLERAFRSGLGVAPWVIAIGTDSPGLPLGHIEAACAALNDGASAVLGPSEDGGYYLIGLRSCPDGLLRDLPWSTPDVFALTLERLRARHIDSVVLPSWFDVDQPADLARLRQELTAGRIEAPATLEVLRRRSSRTATWPRGPAT